MLKSSVTLLLLLFGHSICAAEHESTVQHVNGSLFESAQRPALRLVWVYTYKTDNQNQSLYRARFISKMTPDCIAQVNFASPDVLNKLNRKTEFSLVEEQLKGKRPAGLLNITFDTHVEILDQLAEQPPSFTIEQSLYNYNMFVDEADFSYQLQPISETEVLVDVQASNTVRSSIPGWVNNLFQSNVDDKVLHFQAALTALCSNWKKPSES